MWDELKDLKRGIDEEESRYIRLRPVETSTGSELLPYLFAGLVFIVSYTFLMSIEGLKALARFISRKRAERHKRTHPAGLHLAEEQPVSPWMPPPPQGAWGQPGPVWNQQPHGYPYDQPYPYPPTGAQPPAPVQYPRNPQGAVWR